MAYLGSLRLAAEGFKVLFLVNDIEGAAMAWAARATVGFVIIQDGAAGALGAHAL